MGGGLKIPPIPGLGRGPSEFAGEPIARRVISSGMSNTNTQPDHVERLDHDPNPPAVKSAVDARQGNIMGVVRYVLFISIGLTLAGFLFAYLLG
jgi:hypothetical protein